MIHTAILDLENLENRKYIHGTATVRGVTKELVEKFSNVTYFNIRLMKPLTNLPMLCAGEEYIDGKPNAKGTFVSNGKTIPFYLLDSDEPCTKFREAEEPQFEGEIVDGHYQVKVLPTDDLLLMWHALLKQRAYELFQSLGLADDGRQMWFVGAEFKDISALLSIPAESIGYGLETEMLSTYCFKRDMYVNGKLVGNRTAVYA